MGKRRKARESALQILFQLDFDAVSPDDALSAYWKERKSVSDVRDYTQWLVSGIISHRQELDELIQKFSENWRISRMAVVDRNVLRMAVFELLYEENVAPAIVLNEAIEIAKKYSTEHAANFVNGILDPISKNLQKIKPTKRNGSNDQE